MLNAFRYERWGDAGEGISRFFLSRYRKEGNEGNVKSM